MSALVLASIASGLGDNETPWNVHVIDSGISGCDGVRLSDVDADGDLDLAVGWEEDGVTRLYLNPGPSPEVYRKWEWIECGLTPNVEDAMIMDVDGDGRPDVVSCSEGAEKRIFVHFAPRSGDYRDSARWETVAFPRHLTGDRRWMFAIPMDVNNDGRMDIVAGGKHTDAKIAWLAAPASDRRDLNRWRFHEMSEAGWVMSLISHDMDGDGDLDVLASDRRASGGLLGVRWLENPGPGALQKAHWTSRFVSEQGDLPDFIDLADMDGDGDIDVVSTCKEPDRVDWHERLDESGLRWKEHEIGFPENAGISKAVKVGDINGDGQLDLVLSCASAEAPKSGMVWLEFENRPPDGNWARHEISGPLGIKYDRIELIDLDGDGDLDALTTEENFGPESRGLGAIWYENPTN